MKKFKEKIKYVLEDSIWLQVALGIIALLLMVYGLATLEQSIKYTDYYDAKIIRVEEPRTEEVCSNQKDVTQLLSYSVIFDSMPKAILLTPEKESCQEEMVYYILVEKLDGSQELIRVNKEQHKKSIVNKKVRDILK